MSWSVTNRAATLILSLLGIGYPVLVYFGLSSFSSRVILFLLLAAIVVRAILFLINRKHVQAGLALLVTVILSIAGIITSELVAIRFYPVIVAATLAAVFTVSLFSGMPIIERFARMRTADIDDYARAYTRKLSKVWIGFFMANGLIAGWTALYASLETWMLYNGLISYILVGTLFIGEWPVRRFLRARHDRKTQSQMTRTTQDPV